MCMVHLLKERKKKKKKKEGKERWTTNLVSVGVEECVVFKVLHWCNLEDCV